MNTLSLFATSTHIVKKGFLVVLGGIRTHHTVTQGHIQLVLGVRNTHSV